MTNHCRWCGQPRKLLATEGGTPWARTKRGKSGTPVVVGQDRTEPGLWRVCEKCDAPDDEE